MKGYNPNIIIFQSEPLPLKLRLKSALMFTAYVWLMVLGVLVFDFLLRRFV